MQWSLNNSEPNSLNVTCKVLLNCIFRDTNMPFGFENLKDNPSNVFVTDLTRARLEAARQVEVRNDNQIIKKKKTRQ